MDACGQYALLEFGIFAQSVLTRCECQINRAKLAFNHFGKAVIDILLTLLLIFHIS